MPKELLTSLAAPPQLLKWANAARSGKKQAFIGNVVSAAQPFLVAWLAAKIQSPLCIVCQDVKQQEDFFHNLHFWESHTLLIPDLELPIGKSSIPDPELSAARLAALRSLSTSIPPLIVVTAEGLHHSAPSVSQLGHGILSLHRNESLDLSHLLERLETAGFLRATSASHRGQFAVRGGILDVFPWQTPLPIRLEFFGDEIESIRSYDPDSQRSIETLDSCELALSEGSDAPDSTVLDHIPPSFRLVSLNDAWPDAPIRIHSDPILADSKEFELDTSDHPGGNFAAGDIVLLEKRRHDFFRQITRWFEQQWTIRILCTNEGEASRLQELAASESIPPESLVFLTGNITRGFTIPKAKLAILTDAEIFGRAASLEARRGGWQRARTALARQAIRFDDFVENDLVVHLDYGIARYRGLQILPGQEDSGEVLTLEYARGSKVYVPLDQGWKVSRYIGIGKKNLTLSELSDGRWQRTCSRAEKSVAAYAERLLRIQADRDSKPGTPSPPDNQWQFEFENSFPFKETPDQLRAIQDTKTDMESPRPMDRLICGDVGFGKTEVAIRAAFKAVMAGRQVALLAPTTVLAQQHSQTLRERMSEYPVTIGLLSRFCTPKQQRLTVAGLRDGSVDIVVGTHRLLSRDVSFKDLGLVIVDEEQRFGVLHKETLKENFRGVDVLTLSATPIPRTLYLSLLGARDMSTIETPPSNRIPIETIICGYDERIIRDAIQRELARSGQIYFLHNRVMSIEGVRKRLTELVPEARIVVGHGQMNENDLEDVMNVFVRGDADILLCTTIIESGLDIPNANTIIIDRADRFGLADLYQLRGRVGRSNHKAYAYLMLPRDGFGTGDARKRLSAIRQYSDLGAGFRAAMRDLEIRGAGNILGTEQSGHILAIGFEFYCRLLKAAVAKIKGEKSPTQLLDTKISLDFIATDPSNLNNDELPAWIPPTYIQEPHERIAAHRRLAEAVTSADLDAVKHDWRDRYGRLPDPARHLLKLAAIRIRAAAANIDLVETDKNILRLHRGGDFIMIGHRHPRLNSDDPVLKLRQILSLLQQL